MTISIFPTPHDFLRRCPPFDRLDAAELHTALSALETLHVDAGAHVLEQSGRSSNSLYIIAAGEAVMCDERGGDRTMRQILEAGELFGYPSMLSGNAPALSVIANTDLTLYRLPQPAFRTLVDNGEFADYFLRSMSDGVSVHAPSMASSASLSGNLATPVKHLMRSDPLFVSAEATVQQAAEAMGAINAGSTLVDSEPPGILTLRDLRDRVLALGLGPATNVGQVMTPHLKTLDSDAPVYAALLFMLEENIHHLALVEEGVIVGIVSSSDLLRHQARSPLHLLRWVENIERVEGVQRYAAEIEATVESLLSGGLGAAQIGQIVSSLNDTLIKRLLKLAESTLGPPPVPYAWIVFGSEGRLEQTLLTDQDNALIYARETDEASSYFPKLAEFTIDGLLEAGFPPCPGGYMATNWCRPLDEWIALFDDWIHEPDPQALMEAGIFFDFRAVHGELSLEPLQQVLTSAHESGPFIAHMVRAAQSFSAPLGFLRRIRTDDDGRVDIKHGAIAPVVALARAAALAAGSRERSTLERLVAAEQAGTMSESGAENLADVLHFLLRLRLEQQLVARDDNSLPSSEIHVDTLSPFERARLKRAFLTIREMQEGMGASFNTGMMR